MPYKELDEHIEDELFDEDYDRNKIDGNMLSSHDFISTPIKSNTGTIDENIIQLQYPLLNLINVIYCHFGLKLNRLCHKDAEC